MNADVFVPIDIDCFKHAVAGGNETRSALEVLCDNDNRNLDLYGDGSFTFENLVEEYFEVLLETFSHRSKLKSCETKQLQVPSPWKCRLEGFSFVDILSAKAASQPRYADLTKSGRKWRTFIIDCGAIPILGTSFGNLLQSRSTACSYQQRIPKGLDVLIAPLARLELIAEELGAWNAASSDIQLVHGVWWNESHKSFGSIPCACGSFSARGHAYVCGKRVTQLDRTRKTHYKGTREELRSVFDLHPLGLVIFGDEGAIKQMDSKRDVDHSPSLLTEPEEQKEYVPGSTLSEVGSGFIHYSIPSNSGFSPNLSTRNALTPLTSISSGAPKLEEQRSTSFSSSAFRDSAEGQGIDRSTLSRGEVLDKGTTISTSKGKMPINADLGLSQVPRKTSPTAVKLPSERERRAGDDLRSYQAARTTQRRPTYASVAASQPTSIRQIEQNTSISMKAPPPHRGQVAVPQASYYRPIPPGLPRGGAATQTSPRPTRRLSAAPQGQTSMPIKQRSAQTRNTDSMKDIRAPRTRFMALNAPSDTTVDGLHAAARAWQNPASRDSLTTQLPQSKPQPRQR